MRSSEVRKPLDKFGKARKDWSGLFHLLRPTIHLASRLRSSNLPWEVDDESADAKQSSDRVVLEVERAGYRDVCLCNLDSAARSEEHTSELQSRGHLVCRLLLEKKD